MVVPNTATIISSASWPCASSGHAVSRATCHQSTSIENATATYASSASVSHFSQRT